MVYGEFRAACFHVGQKIVTLHERLHFASSLEFGVVGGVPKNPQQWNELFSSQKPTRLNKSIQPLAAHPRLKSELIFEGGTTHGD